MTNNRGRTPTGTAPAIPTSIRARPAIPTSRRAEASPGCHSSGVAFGDRFAAPPTGGTAAGDEMGDRRNRFRAGDHRILLRRLCRRHLRLIRWPPDLIGRGPVSAAGECEREPSWPQARSCPDHPPASSAAAEPLRHGNRPRSTPQARSISALAAGGGTADSARERWLSSVTSQRSAPPIAAVRERCSSSLSRTRQKRHPIARMTTWACSGTELSDQVGGHCSVEHRVVEPVRVERVRRGPGRQ